MKNKNKDRTQVFLSDPVVLQKIGNLLKQEVLTLDVGVGKGALIKILPYPRIGVEVDRRFETYLKEQNIIWGNYLKLSTPLEVERVVGNLPFSGAFRYVLQTYGLCPKAKSCYFIVPATLVEKLGKPGRLGFMLRLVYDMQPLFVIRPDSFDPRPKIASRLIVLKRKECDGWSRIITNLKRCVSSRKLLKKFYPGLDIIGHKRIDGLSLEEEAHLADFLRNLD